MQGHSVAYMNVDETTAFTCYRRQYSGMGNRIIDGGIRWHSDIPDVGAAWKVYLVRPDGPSCLSGNAADKC